jgi:methyl-accepting chemotaxis protein
VPPHGSRSRGILGNYTAWEPDAFDGRDAEFVNTAGHDVTGCFVPYWNRGAGSIAVEPLIDYTKEGAGDYYLIPVKSGKEKIIDPYVYPVGGRDVLMTSVVVPILVDGQARGMVGYDFDLGMIRSQLAEVKPYGTGYAGETGRASLWLRTR